MLGLNSIPAKRLRHWVTIRHVTSEGTQDEFGQYQQQTSDSRQKCHFEFHTYNDESERVKNKEFVLEYDLLLLLLPTSNITQGDQITLLTDKNNVTIFEHEEGNPMSVTRVFKIPTREGVHHIEAYCKFHHPQLNA